MVESIERSYTARNSQFWDLFKRVGKEFYQTRKPTEPAAA